MSRRQGDALDRSKLAKQAKPLGDLILGALRQSRGGTPPCPTPVRKCKTHRRSGNREAPILHACLHWLKEHGIFAWRNNSGTLWTNGQPVSFGYQGSPDVIGILPDGRFLGVECKSTTGKQSAKQKAFQEKTIANHGVYILARSVEDLERALRK